MEIAKKDVTLQPKQTLTIMKKTLFLLAICLMPLFDGTVNAQSIIGTWVTDGKAFLDDDDEVNAKKADMLLTFNGNKTVTVTFDYLMAMSEDGISGEIGVKGSVSGSYQITGKEITVNCNKQSAKINLYKVDIKLTPEMESAMAAAGMTKAQFEKMVKESINPDQFKSSFDDIDGKMTITTLTATQLALTDEDGTTMSFRRK